MKLKSLKLKALGAVAALGLAGGAALAAVPHADAATIHCGVRCVSFASGASAANTVVTVGKGGTTSLSKYGYNPHEDFQVKPLGTAWELSFHRAGQTGTVAQHLAKIYGSEIVYQFEYTPYGEITGKCLGPSSLSAGASVVVLPCTDFRTEWIGIHRHQSGDFEPFVNAAASTSSVMVLQSNGAGSLTIGHLSLSGDAVASDQMFESLIGYYGEAIKWPLPGGEPSWLLR